MKLEKEDYLDPACPLCGKPGEEDSPRPVPVDRIQRKLCDEMYRTCSVENFGTYHICFGHLYLLCQIFGRVSNGIHDRTFDTEIETFVTKDEVEPHIKITFTDYNEHGKVSDAYTETYIIPVNSVIMERENVTYFYKEKDDKGGK